MLDVNKIYCMDNIQGMGLLDDSSVDLTLTSPPYDNLRNYNGFAWDFEGLAKELFRVTKTGGVIVWIVGDATIKGSETGSSFRQALYFKDIGFNLHDTMIYHKLNYVPLTHNRYEQCFEYMFILSKGKPKTFNPKKILCKGFGKVEKYGLSRRINHGKNHAMRLYDNTTFISTKKEKIAPNIFDYTLGKEKTGHPAPFPEQLATDHILSWSNENDLVLDPFVGSGTTVKMAKLNKRNYIGFEISQEYCDIAESRLEKL